MSITKLFTILSVLIFSINIAGADNVSPLTSINVSPPTVISIPGITTILTALGFGQDSNPVTIPGQVTWSVSNMAVGTVTQINITAGSFTALAPGTTQVNATVQNITGSATVTIITGSLPPEVEAYDVNHDGHIQKNEAVLAVVEYFAGNITKAAAVNVVVFYFTG